MPDATPAPTPAERASATVAALVAGMHAARTKHTIRRDRCNAIAAEWLSQRDEMLNNGAHVLALAATWRAKAWCSVADHDPLTAWRGRAEAARLIRMSQEGAR